MAEVHTAQDQRLARSVAIKLLHPALAAQADARLRFEDEARAAAGLSDRHVVAIYDTGEHAGRPYIVMELLPGRTLHDELLDGPLGEARARALIIQVLSALQAAHGGGLIHRDIKPGNILLTASGEAKVADFGIAKGAASSDLTATGLVLGTPSYLAPECVAGGPATVASDLYAVGVVLYEALSGHKPFRGDSPLAVCHAICTEVPTPLRDLRPGVSAEMAGVVTRAMAKEPQDRYQSASEMMQALEQQSGPLAAVGAIADEPTLPVDAIPIVADSMPTVATPVVVNDDVLQSSRVAVRRSWLDRASARALLMAAAVVAALVGVGLFLNIGSHRADTSTDKPLVTVTTVSARSVTTSRPTTSRPTTSTPFTSTPITTAPPTPTSPTSTSPTTTSPTTAPPTTSPPTTVPPTTSPPTTAPPTTAPPTTALGPG
jgi:serine/threonine protein kinase